MCALSLQILLSSALLSDAQEHDWSEMLAPVTARAVPSASSQQQLSDVFSAVSELALERPLELSKESQYWSVCNSHETVEQQEVPEVNFGDLDG